MPDPALDAIAPAQPLEEATRQWYKTGVGQDQNHAFQLPQGRNSYDPPTDTPTDRAAQHADKYATYLDQTFPDLTSNTKAYARQKMQDKVTDRLAENRAQQLKGQYDQEAALPFNRLTGKQAYQATGLHPDSYPRHPLGDDYWWMKGDDFFKDYAEKHANMYRYSLQQHSPELGQEEINDRASQMKLDTFKKVRSDAISRYLRDELNRSDLSEAPRTFLRMMPASGELLPIMESLRLGKAGAAYGAENASAADLRKLAEAYGRNLTDEQRGFWGKVGQFGIDTAPFITEMAVSGGLSAPMEAALEGGLKAAMGGASKSVVKDIVAKGVATGATITAVRAPLTVPGRFIEAGQRAPAEGAKTATEPFEGFAKELLVNTGMGMAFAGGAAGLQALLKRFSTFKGVVAKGGTYDEAPPRIGAQEQPKIGQAPQPERPPPEPGSVEEAQQRVQDLQGLQRDHAMYGTALDQYGDEVRANIKKWEKSGDRAAIRDSLDKYKQWEDKLEEAKNRHEGIGKKLRESQDELARRQKGPEPAPPQGEPSEPDAQKAKEQGLIPFGKAPEPAPQPAEPPAKPSLTERMKAKGRAVQAAPIEQPGFGAKAHVEESLTEAEKAGEEKFSQTKYEDIPQPLRDRTEKIVDALKGEHAPDAIRQSARSAYAAAGEDGLKELLALQEERFKPISETLDQTLKEYEAAQKEMQDELAKHVADAKRGGRNPASVQSEIQRVIHQSAQDAAALPPAQEAPEPARKPRAGAAQAADRAATNQSGIQSAGALRSQAAGNKLKAANEQLPPSILSLVKKSGGISEKTAKNLGWDVDALKEVIPTAFRDNKLRSGKRDPSELADELIRQGHLPPYNETTTHGHEHLRQAIEGHLRSLEGSLDKIHEAKFEEYQREKQRAVEDGESHVKIREATEAGARSGQNHGSSEPSEEAHSELLDESAAQAEAALRKGSSASDFPFGANEPVGGPAARSRASGKLTPEEDELARQQLAAAQWQENLPGVGGFASGVHSQTSLPGMAPGPAGKALHKPFVEAPGQQQLFGNRVGGGQGNRPGGVNLQPAIEAIEGAMAYGQRGVYEWKRGAGRMFPATTAIDRLTGEAQARFAGSHIDAIYKASGIIDKTTEPYLKKGVLGFKSLSDADAREIGATYVEWRLRHMQQAYQDQAAIARAQGDPIKARQMEQAAKNVTSIFADDESPFQTYAEWQQSFNSPKFQDFKELWKDNAGPILDDNYRKARGMDPTDPIDSFTQIPEYPIHLLRKIPEEMDTVEDGGASLKNTQLGKFPFAKQATGSATYEYDIRDIIRYTLAKSIKNANKADWLREGASRGVYQFGPKNTRLAITQADGTTVLGREIPNVNPPLDVLKDTLGAGESLYVVPKAEKEALTVLNLEKAGMQAVAKAIAPVFRPFNIGNLMGSGAEVTAHIINQTTSILEPGTNPLMLPVYAIKKVMGSQYIKDRLSELAGISAAKEPGLESLGGETRHGVLPFLGKFDPTALGSRLIEVTGDACRLMLDDAAKRGSRYAQTETNRRDIINHALGQYNKLAQPAITKFMRDSQIQPYSSAATAFGVNPLYRATLTPGGKAPTKTMAALNRLEMMARIGAILSLPLAINYISWGNIWGDDDVPAFGIKTSDGPDGKSRYIDWPAKLASVLRVPGVKQIIAGVRYGKSAKGVFDDVIQDAWRDAIHPMFGPGPQFIQTAVSGKNIMGKQLAPEHDAGAKLVTALENVNQPVAIATGANKPKEEAGDWTQMAGTFAPKKGYVPPREPLQKPKKPTRPFGMRQTVR